MGNEMGNRNVSGLQEEDKAVGEEIEKNLAKGDCEDEVIGKNHVVSDVKDKDFNEKVDDLSGGQLLEDGNSLQGQENESDKPQLSSKLAETEASKESDDDKPLLDTNVDGDTETKDQVTTEKDILEETGETEETEEIVISTLSPQEKFNFEIVGPVINSAEEVVSYDEEPILLEEKAAQEENHRKDAIVGDEGENSFLAVDSAASSEEVIDSVSQEMELISKLQSVEEKGEIVNVGDEGIGFPLCGSLDSSREFVEPLEKTTHLTQEPESLGNEKEGEEGKCEITNMAEKDIETNQEPDILMNEKAAEEDIAEVSEEEFVVLPIGSQDTAQKVDDALKVQEERKHEVQCVDDTEITFLPADSPDDYPTSFESQSKSIPLPQEGKYEDANDSQIVIPSSQEVYDTEEKTICLVQETELIVKEKETREENFVSLENSFPLLGSIIPSQELTELTIPKQSCQENKAVVTDNGTKEEKIIPEGNDSPILGSTIVPREVTLPTELIVTKQNSPANKSATRKSPSFDFDLALESRPSQDSDRTPLLSQDKGATRSQSSLGQQTYQNKLEDEESLVEEKTIMMERSYSEKSTSFMSFLRKEEKGSVENKNKTRYNNGNDSKSEETVMLSSGKAKRKQKSSFLSVCICCDV